MRRFELWWMVGFESGVVQVCAFRARPCNAYRQAQTLARIKACSGARAFVLVPVGKPWSVSRAVLVPE
jgi:predicted xylose isomerase-like sugar epimerase